MSRGIESEEVYIDVSIDTQVVGEEEQGAGGSHHTTTQHPLHVLTPRVGGTLGAQLKTASCTYTHKTKCFSHEDFGSLWR